MVEEYNNADSTLLTPTGRVKKNPKLKPLPVVPKSKKLSQESLEKIAEETGFSVDDLRKDIKAQGGIGKFADEYGSNIDAQLRLTKTKNDNKTQGVKAQLNRVEASIKRKEEEFKKQQETKTDISDKIIRQKQAETAELEKQARQAQKTQLAVNGISAAFLGAAGAYAAFVDIKNAKGDFEKELDGWANAATSVGGALLMIPTPLIQIAGAVTIAVSQIGKFVLANVGMQGVIKRNKELVS